MFRWVYSNDSSMKQRKIAAEEIVKTVKSVTSITKYDIFTLIIYDNKFYL